MGDLFWLSQAQVRRIQPYFPLSHGVPRTDDQRVVSGILYVIRNGLRWRDAPAAYGPHKTLYNRFITPPRSTASARGIRAACPRRHEGCTCRIRRRAVDPLAEGPA